MRNGGSVASHRSALFLHGFDRPRGVAAELTMSDETSTGRPSLGILYRSPLEPCDRTAVGGLPATGIARSVVDASRCLSKSEMADLINVVMGRRLVTPLLREVLAPWSDAIMPGPEQTEADEARRRAIEALGWKVGVLHRRDLRPGSHGWIERLRADLAAGCGPTQ